LDSLKQIESEFRKVGLTISADTVRDLIKTLESSPHRQNFQWLMDQIASVERLAAREMAQRTFLYIPPERAKFFPRRDNQHIFGQAVSDAFPSAMIDVEEAGVCLALARPTASVFHLMRVLEIGLTVLGAKFNVSLAHTNWGPAIVEIESKIRDMHKAPVWKGQPDCKQQQEFYAQAASHFGILKGALTRTG
jgi:hypothetical protein